MAVHATAARSASTDGSGKVRVFGVLARAGFRRYSTYRQATLAAAFTNSVFGFLRCSVLLAVAAASVDGSPGGYTPQQLATYTWVTQALIGIVLLWGFTDLSDRIRSGDVVTDLLRPVHPVVTYLATDLGRAAHACLIRFGVPIVVGAVFFDLHLPQRALSYPLFGLSVLLAVLISFSCRYLLNSVAYWILDVRGLLLMWTFATSCCAGLAFPLHFLPSWAVWPLWLATPFPSMLQAPVDVIVERGTGLQLAGVVLGQAAWAALLLAACVLVQRRAERRLVIQGG
jgi:ABC-2 type transport system permease protein